MPPITFLVGVGVGVGVIELGSDTPTAAASFGVKR